MDQKDSWMLQSIYHQYPKLRQVYGDKFQVSNVTPMRAWDGREFVQNRQSEFYQQGEPGGGDMLPNPGNPNNVNLEFYNPDSIHNQDVRRSLTLAEMLHGLHNDQTWASLKSKFLNQFSPETQAANQEAYRRETYPNLHGPYTDWQNQPNLHYQDTFNSYLNRNLSDAYLRAGFFQNPQSTQGLHVPEYTKPYDYFNNNEWLGAYSPSQFGTMMQMQNYLKGK